MSSRPKVGVGVFVTSPSHPGCVLLGKRRVSDGAGTWALPGGHLEHGESWAACAKRECMEETGVEIHGEPTFLGVTNDTMEGEGRHYITIFMRATVKTSQQVVNKEPDKCESWHWRSWESVKHSREDELFVPINNFIASGLSPLAEPCK